MVPQGLWGAAFLLLWLIATWLALKEALLRFRFLASGDEQQEQDSRRYAARLLLLGSAGLTLLAFLYSSAPAIVPATASRYLVGLVPTLPAVLWPLWHYARLTTRSLYNITTTVIYAAALLLVIGVFMLGTIISLQQIPTAQALYQGQQQLIDDLLRLKATRIYSDYWTCDSIIFQSNEHIICSVLDGNLQAGQNRYAPYVSIVQHAPGAAYVFHAGSAQATNFVRRIAQSNRQYRRTVVDGYIIFQPITSRR